MQGQGTGAWAALFLHEAPQLPSHLPPSVTATQVSFHQGPGGSPPSHKEGSLLGHSDNTLIRDTISRHMLFLEAPPGIFSWGLLLACVRTWITCRQRGKPRQEHDAYI